MTPKEQTRLQVLNGVLADQVPVCQAAEVLGVSERHMRRILAAYRKEGAAALAHGNRGRRPANTTTETNMTYVVQLARTRYAGTNHTHLTELLMEREAIDLSRSTVRRILVSAGMDSPRRRWPPRHRVRRKRMAQEGMLLQIDGSHHRWLGEQGPRFALLLTVDDATGTVPDALFSQEEDTRGYFLLMEGLIRRCGMPLAVYSDRHAVFKHTGEVGRKPAGPTQFARSMEELGIRQIFATSPQAKGRVERTAGTFQDRLVTELRLAGVTTIDEANAVLHRFLPRFNEKFGVPAEHASVAYRPMESSVSLDQILCFKHRRKVARDNTVKYNWRTLQLLPGKERPSYAGAQLEVHEGLDGQLLVQYRGRTIPTQEAPPRPGVLRAPNGPLQYGHGLDRRVNGVGNHTKESLASLGAIEADSATWNGDGRVRKPPASPRRKSTPRQRVRWKAVQQAKLRGLSIQAIARELGIHRNTVRKYAEAKSPPMMRTRVRSRVSQADGMTAAWMDIFPDHLGGHNRWTSTSLTLHQLHAQEPAEQQVVVQLLAEGSLAPDREQPNQQRRLQQALGRNGRPPHVRIHPVELGRKPLQRHIGQDLDGAERVIGWHALLQVQEGQHRHLRLLPSTHTLNLPLGCSYLHPSPHSSATVRINVFQQPARGREKGVPQTG